jgi:protein TonB
MWAFENARVEISVAPGIAMTARFASEEERPIEEFVSLDVVERKTELEPQKVEVEREIVEQPPERFEVSDVAATVVVPQVAGVKSQDEPDEPIDELPPTQLRRKMAEPPPIELAVVPQEFQTAAIAGAVDEPARPLVNPSATYPIDALRAGIYYRSTLVRARVATDGTVVSAAIEQSSGWPSMDDEALRTIRLWRFRPAMRHGGAVEFDYRRWFDFVPPRG